MTNAPRPLRALFALGVLALLPVAATAAPLETINVGLTSRSGTDWGIEAATKLGYFARNGIDVQLFVAGSSAAVALQLTGGSVDIGSVSTTQLVQSIAGGAPLVEILKNVTTTPYTIFGRKGITSMSQLRGKTIMIGGPNDITRVFMDKILASYGMGPDEYSYLYAGAPAARYAALLSGAIDAAPLLPPVTFSAADAGFPILDRVPKYFPRFPTSGYAARSGWATSHRDLVIRFVEAIAEGVHWLHDPANKAAAIQLLIDSAGVTPDVAEKSYETYLLPGNLLPEDGRFAPDDFPQVIDVLIRTKQIAKSPAAPVYDNSYVAAAMALLHRKH
jgi:NitT/TauT family transport system substrate-binding protein